MFNGIDQERSLKTIFKPRHFNSNDLPNQPGYLTKALVKESIPKTWKPFQQMQGGNQWKGFQPLPHQLKGPKKKTSTASHPKFRRNITGSDLHQRLLEDPHLDHICHQRKDLLLAPNPFRPTQSRQSSWHAGRNSSQFCCFMNANAVRLIHAMRAGGKVLPWTGKYPKYDTVNVATWHAKVDKDPFHSVGGNFPNIRHIIANEQSHARKPVGVHEEPESNFSKGSKN